MSAQTLHACWTSGGGDLSTGSVDKFVFVFSDVASGGCLLIHVMTLFSTKTEEAAVMSPTMIVTIKYGTDYMITNSLHEMIVGGGG